MSSLVQCVLGGYWVGTGYTYRCLISDREEMSILPPLRKLSVIFIAVIDIVLRNRIKYIDYGSR